MPNPYAAAARKARELTNKQLGEELAKIGPLSEARLRELLPSKQDKEEFVKLMQVVERETDQEKQLAYLKDNIQTAGKVVMGVLKFFV